MQCSGLAPRRAARGSPSAQQRPPTRESPTNTTHTMYPRASRGRPAGAENVFNVVLPTTAQARRQHDASWYSNLDSRARRPGRSGVRSAGGVQLVLSVGRHRLLRRGRLLHRPEQNRVHSALVGAWSDRSARRPRPRRAGVGRDRHAHIRVDPPRPRCPALHNHLLTYPLKVEYSGIAVK